MDKDQDLVESSDLLSGTVRPKSVEPEIINSTSNDPPDGGFRAYSIVIGSFLTNGLLFGVINSYSVIYTVLQKRLRDENVPNADSKAALVGALTMGTTFLLSPLSGVLTGLLGLRLTAVLGGSIATGSLLLTSFVVDHVDALYFTYGIMYGLGASLAYTPSLAILGHYFKRYLGRVNGFVTIGSSIFTVIMPSLMKHMIENYGLPWMFRLLAVFTFGIALCGLLFKPIPLVVIEKPSREKNTFKALIKTIVNVQIWKNRKYRLWALSMPVALFGYFVPYVHIQEFIEKTFTNVNVTLPLQCIGATSGLGRLMFGILADKKGIDRILLQQISFYVIGTLTIILPFVKSFELFIVICLGMGIFDGAFIALIGPIAFEFCGSAYAAQAIGCMLGLSATPLSIGPPLAAKLYTFYESYTLPFVLAGISPIIGASLMFTIRFRCRKDERKGASTNGHLSSTQDIEKPPSPLLRQNGVSQQTTL
ncbi:monocarboxylate transporter 10 [Colias croceus]|uniref:monocarboxylate transporter 10 n=1 Tax=Colias crocea TaxID=72248 RepID=UPI001E27E4BC|nr:monocarboxylate transporter 10 [Colias croceus]